MKRPNPQEMAKMKDELYQGLAQGEIDIRQATCRMRKILGMTQKEYAKNIVKISPRILSQFETGSGNPTLATLQRIGLPFGLKVTFLPPENWRMGG